MQSLPVLAEPPPAAPSRRLPAWLKRQLPSGNENFFTHELLREKQPSEKFTTVEEIAALAIFLCSPAAANMTGASLPIDGGWLAQ